MADPAASIRSLYSGGGNFDSDHDDNHSGQQSDYANSSSASSRWHPTETSRISGSPTMSHVRMPGGTGTSAPIGGRMSPINRTEPYAPVPLGQAGIERFASDRRSPLATPLGSAFAERLDTPEYYQGNSTNISLASVSSDYQQRLSPSADSVSFDTETNDENGGENISRALSPMSATSCLSTTATKDGIQGKRWGKSAVPHLEGGTGSKQHQHSPLSGLNDASELHTGMKSEIEAGSLPPITLNEKIRMMNSEPQD